MVWCGVVFQYSSNAARSAWYYRYLAESGMQVEEQEKESGHQGAKFTALGQLWHGWKSFQYAHVVLTAQREGRVEAAVG